MKSHDSAILNEVEEMSLKMFSLPRDKGDHGGLGVVYKPSINLKRVKVSHKYTTFEHMECVLKIKQALLRFCNIYRRGYYVKHRFTVSQFLQEFPEYLESLVDKPGIPLLLGDFNIHMQDVNDHYTCQFQNILKEFNFVQIVPTNHPTHKHGGVLDIMLCQEMELNSLSDVTVYPDGTSSDHNMVSCSLNCNPDLHKSSTSVTYRNFRSRHCTVQE